MTETNKRAAFIPAASNGVFCRVPINVKDVTKSKLDALQSKFTINTGKKISLQNLLDMLLDYALLHEDELIKQMPALRDDPAWNEAMDWGEETDASNVDEYLYG